MALSLYIVRYIVLGMGIYQELPTLSPVTCTARKRFEISLRIFTETIHLQIRIPGNIRSWQCEMNLWDFNNEQLNLSMSIHKGIPAKRL